MWADWEVVQARDEGVRAHGRDVAQTEREAAEAEAASARGFLSIAALPPYAIRKDPEQVQGKMPTLS